jgi:type VI protein secretion system component VasA
MEWDRLAVRHIDYYMAGDEQAYIREVIYVWLARVIGHGVVD